MQKSDDQEVHVRQLGELYNQIERKESEVVVLGSLNAIRLERFCVVLRSENLKNASWIFKELIEIVELGLLRWQILIIDLMNHQRRIVLVEHGVPKLTINVNFLLLQVVGPVGFALRIFALGP